MMRFVNNPNLPKGKVTSVICGELRAELADYLSGRGIEMLKIEPNNNIDPAVKFHADMAVIHLGGNRIILDKCQRKLGEILTEKGFAVHNTAEEIRGEYPGDIKLNFLIIGKYIMGKLDCADVKLVALTENFERINVKQGYCKCSTLVVNENAIITDDESIYSVAVKNGVDTLLISKGDITLPGHEYGFIGGASGKISKTEVLFFGDITKHRDYKKIADFIKKHGCEIISLDFPLTDFGGIVPIVEEF